MKSEEQLRLKNKINDAYTDFCKGHNKLIEVRNDINDEKLWEDIFQLSIKVEKFCNEELEEISKKI